MLEEGGFEASQAPRERIELIPERLGGDVEPMPAEDALLPRERNVIEVFVERDFDRERERVATAEDGTLGGRRRLDAAAAAARVLLLLDLDDAVAHLDDVDHLGFLELPCHRRKAAAAARTHAIGLVELEHPLLEWQARLLRRSGFCAVFRLLRRACRCARRGRARGFLLLLRQRLDERERLLQLGGISLERLELVALALEHAEQLLDLHLLHERDPTELLDVALASDVHKTF